MLLSTTSTSCGCCCLCCLNLHSAGQAAACGAGPKAPSSSLVRVGELGIHNIVISRLLVVCAGCCALGTARWACWASPWLAAIHSLPNCQHLHMNV